jgi:hypothetical protein
MVLGLKGINLKPFLIHWCGSCKVAVNFEV